MMVGNKADLRDAAAAEGGKCVAAYFGEKLAMVRESGPSLAEVFRFCLPLLKRFSDELPPCLVGLLSLDRQNSPCPRPL